MTGSPAKGMQVRALAVVIASVAIMGITYGLTMPLMSLRLEARGIDSGLIGLNAAMAALGVVLMPPLIPMLLRQVGVRPFLLLNLVGTGMALLGLALTDWLPAWFVLRLILGACLAGLFVVSEAWINHLADDRSRGRVLGIYSSVLAAGFTIGPLLLQVTGVEGVLPFLAGLGFLAVAAIPLSLVGGEDPPLSGHPSRGVLGFAAAAPIASSAALVFGAIEAGVLSLLPVYGVRSGLTPEGAAAMAAAIGLGNFAMQVPLGWLADRTNVRWMLVACALAGLAGAVALPFTVDTVLLWPVLFMAGGAMMGIYTLGLTLLGQRFRGPDLAAANGAFVVMYGLGALGGPALTGAAMDAIVPHGLPLVLGTFCLGFAVLATVRTLRGQN